MAGGVGEAVEVAVLGPVVARVAGRPVEVGGRRSRAVLGVLALAGPAGLAVDPLVEQVWAGRPPPTAVRTVRAYLSRLRAVLGPDAVVVRGGTYQLGPDVTVDVRDFRRLVAEGGTRADAGDPRTAAEAWEAALALWRDRVPLAGADIGAVPDLDVLVQERRAVSERLARLWWTLRRGVDAERLLRALLDEDPARESVWAALAEGLYRSGRQADALQALRDATALLRDDLGLDPSPLLADAESAILRQTLPARPGPPAGARRPPIPLSALVGREAEVSAALAALAGHRLVTLVATGGLGKTSIAVEVARRAERAGMAAVWCELVGVPDEGVPEALRVQTGADPGVPEPTAAVAAALAGAPAVLVIDNADDVVEQVARCCAELLDLCPDLRVLVTSRVPLDVVGETVQHVPPLSLTGPDGGDATTLLLVRAEEARAGSIGGADGPALAREVAAAVDGVPLAIELVAARLARHTIADVRTDVLGHLAEARRRGRAERHRSMGAALRSSYDALAPDARRLLRRAAAFRAPWPAVVADMLLDGSDAAAGRALDQLCDCSLVVLTGAGLYRMYEPVRQFAAALSGSLGEADAVAMAHARAVLGLLTLDPRPRRWDDPDWLDAQDARRDDVVAALRSAESLGAEDLLIDLAVAAGPLWRRRWAIADGRRWLTLAHALGGTRYGGAARLAADLALLHLRDHDLDGAERWAQEALARLGPDSDDPAAGEALRALGLVAARRGDDGPARAWHRRSAERSARAGDLVGEALALGAVADLDASRGRFDDAEAAYARGLLLMQAAGTTFGRLAYLHSMAELSLGRGDAGAARDRAAEATRLAEALGDRYHLGLLALIDASLARTAPPAEAAAVALRCLARCDAAGDLTSLLEAVDIAAGVAGRCGAPAEAWVLLSATDTLRGRFGVRLSETARPRRDEDRNLVRASVGARADALADIAGRLDLAAVRSLAGDVLRGVAAPASGLQPPAATLSVPPTQAAS